MSRLVNNDRSTNRSDRAVDGGDAHEEGLVSAAACPACGAETAPDESFCTGCGRALRPEAIAQTARLPEPTVVAGEPTSPITVQETRLPDRRSRRLAIAAGILVALLVGALATATFAWHQQRAAHRKASAQLTDARAEISSLRSKLSATEAKLERTQALST